MRHLLTATAPLDPGCVTWLDPDEPVLTIEEALSAEECEAISDYALAEGFGPAPITTPHGPMMAPDIRNNERLMIDDPAMADALWERLQPALPAEHEGWEAAGLNERLRFYSYLPGQAFHWHLDGAYRRSSRYASRLSLLLYLNEDFSGGETEFSDFPTVVPQTGLALAFHHPLLHRGCTVRSGRKLVLRTDVMYRS